MRTPCKFFNTQRGCIRGDACTFAHERGSSLFSQGGRAPAAGRGGRVQAGRGGGLQSAGGFSSDLLKQLLTELGCSADPQPVLVQRWVQLALQQCERRGAAGAADVLRALRGEDGSSFLRALGQQLTCTQDHGQVLGALVPLLKLLGHEDIRTDPTLANPVFSTLHDSLSLAAVSAALDSLVQQPGAAADGFIRSRLQQQGGMVMHCLPKDWLDVLQPLATYLQEVTTRFSSSLQQNPATLDGANAWMQSMASAAQQHLPAAGAVAQNRATDWRRLLTHLTLLQRQLSAQQDAGKVIEQLQAMQAQLEARQKQQGAAGADAAGGVAGPGELHPSGPRHDNDKVSHLDISVAPTQQEVLCQVKPFLPANRPGTLPHAAHDPDRAHRELHFRLLRHDVIGPVCDAAQAFLQFGGVAQLKSLKNATPGCSVRLHLQSGREVRDMYVFRNVSILALTSTYNGSIGYRIEFDDSPQLAKADTARRCDWWKHTKQLQHGSLVALWWDGDTPNNPHIMFATVSERDEKLLAAQGEPRKRPQLGIRMCGLPVTAELMSAVLGRQQLGGKKEVVLLPAAGSFFAYAPILRALQSAHPLPLARYLLHSQGAASTGSLPALLHGELVGSSAGSSGTAGAVQGPAYAAGADCVYDLTPVASQEKLQDINTDDLRRLARVCISSPEGIPLELLLRATTLDASQAAALAACLSRELAVVQGPPGCGKTYIGVQLVRLLLANTRSSPAHHTPSPVSSSVPHRLRPEIGPILVLCYTNHALDAFLLDLLHCGITEGIIRVGRRSSAAELEPYNLVNQEGGRARGWEVAQHKKRVEALRQQVNDKLLKVQSSRTARRLQWEDVFVALEHTHSAMLDSFMSRGSIIDQAVFLQAAAADPVDKFIQARPRRHGRRMQQQLLQGQGGWVWGADPLQDWLASSPMQDWQRQQWMQRKMQQWEEGQADDAPMGPGFEPGADTGSSIGGSSSSSARTPGPEGAAVASFAPAGRQQGRAAASGSSNQFAALAALGEGPGEADDFAVLLEQLQQSGDTAPTDAAARVVSLPADSGSHRPAAYSDWLMLPEAGSGFGVEGPSTDAAAAAAAATAAAMQDSDADGVSDDGWELADPSEGEQHSSSSSRSAHDSTPAAPSASPAAQPAGDPAKGRNTPDATSPTAAKPQHSPAAASPGGSSGARQHHVHTTATPASAAAFGAAAPAAAPAPAAPAAVLEDPGVPAEVMAREASDRLVEELLQLDDVSAMSRHERQRLYQHWLNTLANQWGRDLDQLISDLEQEQKQLQALYDRAALEVLRAARIVGMTTTGLANKQGLLHGLAPKVVIVEEAAEVLEAHILTSLAPSVEHLVLIGDHFQLPPKVEVFELQKESRQGFDLNKSMFERLVEAGTVQHVTLQQQRRMRPAISQLIRGALYPELKDHPAVTAYPNVKGMVHNLFFWDHDHKEGGTDQSKSRFNEYEVYACLGLAKYLLQQGYGGSEQPDICILTPYVGQLLKLRRELSAVSGLRFVMSDKDAADLAHVITDAGTGKGSFDPAEGSSSSIDGSSTTSSSMAGSLLPVTGNKIITLGRSIRLATIDNFQGEEARIIILSLVRNPREAGAGIGFLAVNNRINVLLSRAKEGMYLVGSSAALQAAAEKAMAAGRPCMWAPVLDHLSAEGCLGKSLHVCCQRHGNTNDITHHRAFAELVGDGGCQQSCGLKLPCGHTCPRRCHADDPNHTQTKCLKKCGRLCARGRHHCELLCHQPCSACAALEELVELPCGHTASNVPCCKAGEPQKILCTQLVTVTYPGCVHKLTVPCGRSSDYTAGTAPCTQQVTVTLPACGHTVTLPCSKAALALFDPTLCTQACGGLLLGCQHTCSSKCGQCMQLLFKGSDDKPKSGTAGAAPAAAGAAGAENSFVEGFLQQLQAAQPDLHAAWCDWQASRAQQASLGQLWLRCLKDLIAKQLGTQQCSMLGVQPTGDNSSTSSSSSSSWPGYINSCRATRGGKSRTERLAAEWQAKLLTLSSDSSSGNNSSSSSSSSTAGAGLLHRPHMPCSKPCDKPLACGHRCQLKCHYGGSCAPCKQACSITCEHAKCHGPCAEPCAPCAEPCGWACEHKGPCLLPCGVPCDREPCNRRCSSMLECGHRCPGLCGERCLPRTFCVHPECTAKAPASVKSRVVDMLLFRTFGELTDADVCTDPLILLSCGHLFCSSTLDGHMGMSEAYERLPASGSELNASSSSSGSNGSKASPGGSVASSSGVSAVNTTSSSSSSSIGNTAEGDSASDLDNWGGPLHRNDFPTPKGCPDCRRVIAGVRRYGRVVLHSQLGVTQRKHAEAIRCSLAAARQKLTQLQQSLLSSGAAWRDSTTIAAADRLIKVKKPLAAGMLTALMAGRGGAWNAGLSFMHLIKSAERTPKQHVMQTHQASVLSAAASGRLDKAAAWQRFQALRKYSSKPDQRQVFEAMQSHASAMQLCLTLDTQQLEALAAALEAVDTALGRQSASEGLGLGDAAGGAGRSGARSSRGSSMWLAEQRRDLAAHVHRVLGQAQGLFTGTVQDVRWAIDAAAKDSSYTASYRLSQTLMLLHVERARQLQPLKKPILAGLAGPQGKQQQAAEPGAADAAPDAVWEQQQQLLQGAEEIGNAAMQLRAVHKQQLLCQADSAEQRAIINSMPSAEIDTIKELLEKLCTIKDELNMQVDAAEVAAVLGALMQAEGTYFNNLGLESFMAGHLYECPNGHLFVIGECGRAMQASRCDRCGACIGGGSHQLDPTNSSASSAVRAAILAAASP